MPRLILRLLLGGLMIPYALAKLTLGQFQVSALDYTKPLGELSGIRLSWAFFAHSDALQFALGLAEFLPAVLLLFHRTHVLGAVLMLPATAAVTAVNFAFDLWLGTRVISAALLSLNLALLTLEWPRIRQFLHSLLLPPAASRLHRLAGPVALAVALTASAVALLPHLETNRQLHHLAGARQSRGSGTFAIERFLIDGRPLALGPRPRLLFDIWRTVHLLDGPVAKHGRFSAQSATQSFSIHNFDLENSTSPISGTYSLPTPQTILLKGARNQQTVEVLLRRIPEI